MMLIAASREIKDGSHVIVGVGRPGLSANLAKQTHATTASLSYESGVLGANSLEPPLSIGDDELVATAGFIVDLPEFFQYWLQPGRFDLGLLEAAQIDKFGNLNTTCIGDYRHPKVRLPGSGGAPEIATACTNFVVVINHDKMKLVDKLDFLTSVGNLDGTNAREAMGFVGGGPKAVVTDMCILRPQYDTGELRLLQTYPGIGVAEIRANTAWHLKVADNVSVVDPPTDEELSVLRRLVGIRKRKNLAVI